eukprot:1184172-Prorocentrum_minimum.AAC.1
MKYARRGIFSRRTNQTQKAQAYSHDGPIRHRKRRHILTTGMVNRRGQNREAMKDSLCNMPALPVSDCSSVRICLRFMCLIAPA